jgi:hypothetical protein
MPTYVPENPPRTHEATVYPPKLSQAAKSYNFNGEMSFFSQD